MGETNIGLTIAITTAFIYIIFGPLILLGIYAFFDWLAEKGPKKPEQQDDQKTYKDKDPSLWTDNDIREYLKQK